jgi:hypothetical protein
MPAKLEIRGDFEYFLSHSTETEAQIAALGPHVSRLVNRGETARLLDFGCGAGVFCARRLHRPNISCSFSLSPSASSWKRRLRGSDRLRLAWWSQARMRKERPTRVSIAQVNALFEPYRHGDMVRIATAYPHLVVEQAGARKCWR